MARAQSLVHVSHRKQRKDYIKTCQSSSSSIAFISILAAFAAFKSNSVRPHLSIQYDTNLPKARTLFGSLLPSCDYQDTVVIGNCVFRAALTHAFMFIDVGDECRVESLTSRNQVIYYLKRNASAKPSPSTPIKTVHSIPTVTISMVSKNPLVNLGANWNPNWID